MHILTNSEKKSEYDKCLNFADEKKQRGKNNGNNGNNENGKERERGKNNERKKRGNLSVSDKMSLLKLKLN